jgi:hypothetical protein
MSRLLVFHFIYCGSTSVLVYSNSPIPKARLVSGNGDLRHYSKIIMPMSCK